MPISENAYAVLERRYLARDEKGQPIETVDGLFHRVADSIAEADRHFDPQADVAATAQEFYRMMTELEFLPNSPTLICGHHRSLYARCGAGRGIRPYRPRLQTGDRPPQCSGRFREDRLLRLQTGEPGIIFLDRLNRDNVVPGQGEIESTNPCGEQPLLPYESCNLGSINLVKHLKKTDKGYELDRTKLEKTIRTAVHFLDNVIEVNKYPLPEIDRVTRATRKIGLGIMGFADMLLYLDIPYNSDEGVAMGEHVMELVNAIGHEESVKLAQTRGAFPLFEESILKGGAPIRNGTVTTIAPTGTLSILAGVSSGVEPVFAYAYIRNVMDNTHLVETNSILREKLEELGIYSEELMKKVVEAGTLAHIDEIPDSVKKVFVCAHDVSPIWHVKMQAAFQRHTDNAVSKTVNFPNSATREDVAEVYQLAFTLGCKGTTIYRDGSLRIHDNQYSGNLVRVVV